MVYADRLMRLLAEEALCRLPSIADDGEVETPVGTAREGGGGNKEWKRDRGGDGTGWDTTEAASEWLLGVPVPSLSSGPSVACWVNFGHILHIFGLRGWDAINL